MQGQTEMNLPTEEETMILMAKKVKKLAHIQQNSLNNENIVDAIQLCIDFIKNHMQEDLLKMQNIKHRKCIASVCYLMLQRLVVSAKYTEKVSDIMSEFYNDFFDFLQNKKDEIECTLISTNTSEAATYSPQSSFDSRDDKFKLKRTNFSKQTASRLKAWLRENINNPYPTDQEKQALSNETGLDIVQINNWFINARRRILPSLKSSMDRRR